MPTHRHIGQGRVLLEHGGLRLALELLIEIEEFRLWRRCHALMLLPLFSLLAYLPGPAVPPRQVGQATHAGARRLAL